MDTLQRIQAQERAIIERLGAEQALEEISKALTPDQKADIYNYICRMWDIEL